MAKKSRICPDDAVWSRNISVGASDLNILTISEMRSSCRAGQRVRPVVRTMVSQGTRKVEEDTSLSGLLFRHD
jgi:hypothetical protein